MSSSWSPLRRWAALAWVSVAAALLLHCQPSAKTEPTGGETHFLEHCQDDASVCGTKLACICGVCTVPCDAQASCGDLKAASCVAANPAETCGDFQAQGHCDVECQLDADCEGSALPRLCDAGVCRPALDFPMCTTGEVTANQVLIIGDSFFALSHQITAYLEELARDAGALPVGERYRDNSSLRSNALALDGNGIEGQYTSGRDEAEVKVVVMSGGGADVLLGSCDPVSADCPLLVDAVAAAEQLLARMAEDGVTDVVFAFYPDPSDAGLREKVDTLRPLLQAACDNQPAICHWVDLRRAFTGHDDYLVDGINPSAAGSRAAAAEIWAAMRQSCIAQ